MALPFIPDNPQEREAMKRALLEGIVQAAVALAVTAIAVLEDQAEWWLMIVVPLAAFLISIGTRGVWEGISDHRRSEQKQVKESDVGYEYYLASTANGKRK